MGRQSREGGGALIISCLICSHIKAKWLRTPRTPDACTHVIIQTTGANEMNDSQHLQRRRETARGWRAGLLIWLEIKRILRGHHSKPTSTLSLAGAITKCQASSSPSDGREVVGVGGGEGLFIPSVFPPFNNNSIAARNSLQCAEELLNPLAPLRRLHYCHFGGPMASTQTGVIGAIHL